MSDDLSRLLRLADPSDPESLSRLRLELERLGHDTPWMHRWSSWVIFWPMQQLWRTGPFGEEGWTWTEHPGDAHHWDTLARASEVASTSARLVSRRRGERIELNVVRVVHARCVPIIVHPTEDPDT